MSRFDYLRNLLRFAFRENPLLYAAVVLSLASVVIELLAMSSLFPLFALVSGSRPAGGGVVARALESVGIAATSTAFLWAFIVLFAARIATQIVAQSLSMYLSKRVMAQLGSRAFEQIVQRVAVKEVSQKSIGFYIALAGDEAFRASTLVMSLIQFGSTSALALLYYLAILMYSTATGVLVFAFLVTAGVPFLIAMRATHRLGVRQTEESRRAHSIFLDSLNNLKAVRAFSAETYTVGLYRAIIFRYARTLFQADAIAMLTKLVPVLLLLVMFAGWLMLSTRPIESVGLAFVVTMIVYLMRFFPVVGQCVVFSMKVASDAKAGKDVTAIVAAHAAEQRGTEEAVGPIERVELRDVAFAYDDKPSGVLSGVSLKFERGRSYALTGKSGVGKSTLLDLLLKFHFPSAGSICLNDVATTRIADGTLRQKVILVTQEPAIFDDTVANNVRLGMVATPEQIEAACCAACVHDVIEALPQGYETRLQYQGRNLSGGQRQRIAIARALLRNADVLVFDEATSALDKLTQARVVDNILRQHAERIVIFVTHDPHITGRVDTVIDLERVNAAAAQLREQGGAAG